jgi:hypothetical protein
MCGDVNMLPKRLPGRTLRKTASLARPVQRASE